MLLLYTNRGVLHFYIASRISIRALEGFFMTPVVVWHSGSLKLLLLQEARAHSSQSAVMLIAKSNISRRQVGLPAPCALPGLVDEGLAVISHVDCSNSGVQVASDYQVQKHEQASRRFRSWRPRTTPTKSAMCATMLLSRPRSLGS